MLFSLKSNCNFSETVYVLVLCYIMHKLQMHMCMFIVHLSWKEIVNQMCEELHRDEIETEGYRTPKDNLSRLPDAWIMRLVRGDEEN